MPDKVVKSNEEWRKTLSPERYRILREKGTEPAFTGEYYYFKKEGIYRCAACDTALFSSKTKFESGSGWPSFWAPYSEESVWTQEDRTHGMERIEVLCKRCDSHLGHLFDDGPPPTGRRYCINSASLRFEEKELV